MARTITTLSKVEYWRTAEMIPNGMPTSRAMAIDSADSIRVVGKTFRISVTTGVSVSRELPRSPWNTALKRYLPNWTRKGAFSPWSSR